MHELVCPPHQLLPQMESKPNWTNMVLRQIVCMVEVEALSQKENLFFLLQVSRLYDQQATVSTPNRDKNHILNAINDTVTLCSNGKQQRSRNTHLENFIKLPLGIPQWHISSLKHSATQQTNKQYPKSGSS